MNAYVLELLYFGTCMITSLFPCIDIPEFCRSCSQIGTIFGMIRVKTGTARPSKTPSTKDLILLALRILHNDKTDGSCC